MAAFSLGGTMYEINDVKIARRLNDGTFDAPYELPKVSSFKIEFTEKPVDQRKTYAFPEPVSVELSVKFTERQMECLTGRDVRIIFRMAEDFKINAWRELYRRYFLKRYPSNLN